MNGEEEKKNIPEEPEYQILNVDDVEYKTTLTTKFNNRKPFQDLEWDKIYSFISGTIRKIYVKKGKKVKEGDKLLILEAMKMKNVINSPVQGKIKKVHVSKDERVPKNKLLIEIE
ncbi:MAG: acetyl-CoA carboxylase biotin carboxyl carrier protein subunit [Bacteroidales bacterium]|nr:acetyl-CoA carboxylase biotin carboxyl carrier protein subunit [Bacteroidales bacterium]MCF8387635.1 acetyl-CoA carboxylase biotin carboxyl carrier protein subunit [Bacteroidales bacterium]MCF8397943.1 acetyl-CoA carboxylase biotin carboxyl carrier protein subunit [Bacteroidales bacterium]